MYYTIYKITNQINGKFYIGSHKTKDLNDGYMGSGKYLKHAQEKYGIENFIKETLFVFDTSKEMFAKEAELVSEDFLATENTYNLKIGGFGGWDFINERGFVRNDSHFIQGNKVSSKGGSATFEQKKGIHDPEVKELSRKKNKEKYPLGTFAGKSHTSETKQRIGEKNSKHQSGQNNSQFGTMWITNDIESKKIKKNLTIPIGWSKGRKITREEISIDNVV